jgi:hypothetical protein
MKTAEQITASTRVIASESAVGCDIQGEMVLLHLDSGIYFGLNAVGADIWNFIREERVVEEIERHLLGQYNVSPARCQSEVVSLLRQLSEKGLIRCQ